jgi:hypothetical protein
LPMLLLCALFRLQGPGERKGVSSVPRHTEACGAPLRKYQREDGLLARENGGKG